ncbi:MAG: YihY/virulence factor BrkB family protein [Verrucomicrobiae bacterium]|nr:YihY/virulence factor BrkB family protein [Verrucomicrobiae bacterium]
MKKWFQRLAQIASSSFDPSKEDDFLFEGGLSKFERFFHFWALVGSSFVRNRCPIRASALSFTTMVAMIPILTVVLGVANAILESKGEAQIRAFIAQMVERIVPAPTGTNQPPVVALTSNPEQPLGPVSDFTSGLDRIQFGVDELRARQDGPLLIAPEDSRAVSEAAPAGSNASANAQLPSPSESTELTHAKESVAEQVANFIYGFAKKSSSATLGFTGMFFLIVTAILTLARVEEVFNDIWGVAHGRDWWSRITNYTFTIGFGPTLLILALGLMNQPNFQRTRDLITIIPFLEPLITSLLPVTIIAFTFALFYKLVPNTRVNFSAALVGGVLAGVAWHFYNHLGFLLASRWVNANKIYGGLAIVPLFMGGLYISWLTVLFGAQVAYAFQNRASYLQDRLAENVNQRGREFVALRLMTCIGQRFQRGLPPATVRQITSELGIPSKLVQQIMHTLLASQLVVEVGGVEVGYSPARPLETINCHQVLYAMRAAHGQEPATRDEPVRLEVLGEFARIQAAEEHAATAVSMRDLVDRAQARLALNDARSTHAAINVESAVATEAALKSEPAPPLASRLASASEIEVDVPAASADVASPVETNAPTLATTNPPAAAPAVAALETEEQDFPL